MRRQPLGLATRLFAPAPRASVPMVRAGYPATTSGPSLPALGSLPTASGVLVSQATSLQVTSVYACVRIRARDLARCTPQILRDDGRGNKAIVGDHPLAKLFAKPNRVQTWFPFAEQLHIALMLRSNGYAAILRDWRGNPTELIPLNPDLVTPMESPDGSLFYNVARAGLWLSAVLANEPVVIPAEDVLHIRDLTFNTLVGVSRIALARDAIGLAMVQEQQAARWAGNGARPSGVLQSKKTISPDAASRLRQQWDELQSGLQNTGRTAILEDGLEWKQMALSSVDLEFGQARLTQVKEIARVFEVPLHKLGENESLPRASIAELNADYVQNVVMSDATRWEQAFAHQFGIAEEGLEVKLDEKALLRADLATMTNAARTGVMSGLLTQNEGRTIIGYGPMDGADTLLAPVNLAPNGSALDGTAPDDAGRPPVGLNPGDMKALSKAIAGDVAKLLKTFDPSEARDPHGEWTGAGSGEDGAATGDTFEASHAALSHEIQLAVKATAIVAAVAIAPYVLPEAVAGSFLVAGALSNAENYAFDMYARAGLSAAKHALNDMGVDTSKAESLLAQVGMAVTKGGTPDAHDAKLLVRLAPVLRGAADLAQDTLIAELRKQRPTTPDDMIQTIEAARTAYLARLAQLVPEAAPSLKYSADQPRDSRGRFAAGADEAPAGLSTGAKVRLAVGALGLLALGAAAHRKVPYKSHGSAILNSRYSEPGIKAALEDLHRRSVHTPITDAERASVIRYTTSAYRDMNRKLRLGHKPGEDVANIDSALQKSLLAENTVVYRGVNLDRSKRLLGKVGPGDVFVDKGFASASLSEDVARNFALSKDGAGSSKVGDPGKAGYVWSVNVDKGANVLPLTDRYTAHENGNFKEMLLPRNSAFKVLDVDHESKTIYMQHVRLGEHLVKAAADPVRKAQGEADAAPDADTDRFLAGLDDELDWYAAPEGDTTAVDYAGYRPPQPVEASVDA